MRRAARIDGTHREIVDVLRAMGASVLSLAAVGKGCPDLVVAFRGRTYLAEIKNGKLVGWRLTNAQKRFRATWNAPIAVLDSVDTAVAWLNRLAPQHSDSVFLKPQAD